MSRCNEKLKAAGEGYTLRCEICDRGPCTEGNGSPAPSCSLLVCNCCHEEIKNDLDLSPIGGVGVIICTDCADRTEDPFIARIYEAENQGEQP